MGQSDHNNNHNHNIHHNMLDSPLNHLGGNNQQDESTIMMTASHFLKQEPEKTMIMMMMASNCEPSRQFVGSSLGADVNCGSRPLGQKINTMGNVTTTKKKRYIDKLESCYKLINLIFIFGIDVE